MSIIKQLAEYASLLWLVLEVLLVAVLVVICLVKRHKDKVHEESELEKAQEERDIAINEALDTSIVNKLVMEVIPAGIKVAEHLGVSDGKVKKMLCLSHVMQLCFTEHIDFEKYVEVINGEIEKLIAFSKEVNVKGR